MRLCTLLCSSVRIECQLEIFRTDSIYVFFSLFFRNGSITKSIRTKSGKRKSQASLCMVPRKKKMKRIQKTTNTTLTMNLWSLTGKTKNDLNKTRKFYSPTIFLFLIIQIFVG